MISMLEHYLSIAERNLADFLVQLNGNWEVMEYNECNGVNALTLEKLVDFCVDFENEGMDLT